jgi:hypothetical protein
MPQSHHPGSPPAQSPFPSEGQGFAPQRVQPKAMSPKRMLNAKPVASVYPYPSLTCIGAVLLVICRFTISQSLPVSSERNKPLTSGYL